MCINIGPFAPTLSRSEAVDFSLPIINEQYSIAVPIKSEDDLWSFLHPFNLEVWIASFISIPIFMIAMVSADYLYTGSLKWGISISFVLRIALMEQSLKIPDKTIYNRIFVIIWTASVFVLAQSYAGTLTAMITRPGLHKTIRNANDLLNQKDFSWVMEDGLGIGEYMKASPPGSTWRNLLEQASFLSYDEEWYGACHTTTTRESGKIASICDIYSLTDLISRDYRKVIFGFKQLSFCFSYCDRYKVGSLPAIFLYSLVIPAYATSI